MDYEIVLNWKNPISPCLPAGTLARTRARMSHHWWILSAGLYLRPKTATSHEEHLCPQRGNRKNMRTILLLTISNVFMTFAWYGHLKYRTSALWKVILVSWGIAFFEYCFQVPANRIGSYEFSTAQLKTMQEVITLSVFSAFSVLYLGEKIKWNYAAGFGCIALAVFFVFHKW
jgi:uncharacterized protein (DUF486 family)